MGGHAQMAMAVISVANAQSQKSQYKAQQRNYENMAEMSEMETDDEVLEVEERLRAVSYTHLTLPTSNGV